MTETRLSWFVILWTMTWLGALATAARSAAQELTVESARPVVIRTLPVAGTSDVDPALSEIRATFSKPMRDGNWSWSVVTDDSVPDIAFIERLEKQDFERGHDAVLEAVVSRAIP